MNMVWQHVHCFDEHTVLCRCREQNILESHFDRIHKNFHAILGAPHDVVLEAEHYPGILLYLLYALAAPARIMCEACHTDNTLSTERTYLSPEGDSPRPGQLSVLACSRQIIWSLAKTANGAERRKVPENSVCRGQPCTVVVGTTTTGVPAGASGNTIHSTRYRRKPVPPKKIASNQTTRTMVGSRSK